MTSNNEETYLEAFIESINDLPHEIKRDLELIGSLDRKNLTVTEELQKAQDTLVTKAENTVVEMVEKKMKQQQEETISNTDENDVNTNDNNNQRMKNEISIPTTEELEAIAWDPREEEKITQLRKKARLYHKEKVIVAEHCLDIVESTLSRLDNDINSLETLLKGSGVLESMLLGNNINGTLASGGTGGSALQGKPNDLAAIQQQNEWILAKIITRDPETGMYKLSDEDTESDKIFTLPESQVVILTGMEPLAKADVIYAVYPDTTSFYQATVVQAPRKIYGGSANTAGAGSSSFVLVNFHDDGDEHGVTHDKAVLMKHVMRPPFLSA